ncbi:MAG TPA: glycosyltransferase [Thermomicrobiales bacterium]|nr:glycosyltransferase [Thermomicrobiales bacterium]
MHTVLYPVNELKIGGAEQQLLELVRGIDKRRFRVIVAPLYGGGALEPEFRAVSGVEVVNLNRRGKYDPSPLFRIARLLRRYRVDIVQPFLSPATFFGLLPALLVRTPVTIVTERCGARKVRGRGYHMYRAVEDRLSRFADAVVPNSVAGKEMLIERGVPVRLIRVIYNGINRERLHVDQAAADRYREMLSVPPRGTVVGILASLTPPKGHDVLFRALAELCPQYPGLRCAVIGDGVLRTELENLATELGIRDRLVFFGYLRDVANALGACDVLVSASRDNEGCSNSILEAMALNIPVIATDIGGNREVVVHGKTGQLIPVGDHQAMAHAIEYAMLRPVEVQAFARLAAERISTQFSLSRMVRDYERLYTELLAAKSRARTPQHTDQVGETSIDGTRNP